MSVCADGYTLDAGLRAHSTDCQSLTSHGPHTQLKWANTCLSVQCHRAMNRISPIHMLGLAVAALLGATVAAPWVGSRSPARSPNADRSVSADLDQATRETVLPDCQTEFAWRRQLTTFLSGSPVTATTSDCPTGNCTPSGPTPGPPTPDPISTCFPVLPEELKELQGLRFLITTVPDPKYSSAGHGFDQRLDALQKAVTSQGYLLDRFYLPWQTEPANPEGTPGVIVFRRTPPQVRTRVPFEVLLVFLIGESPTFGIHKRAFESAVDEVFRIRTFRQPDLMQMTIPIVGTSYSGAGESLAQSLRSVHERYIQNQDSEVFIDFDVTFGSTTALQSERFLTIANGAAGSRVWATTNPSWFREKALKEFVSRRNPLPGKIQMIRLVESNTGYGNRPAMPQQKPDKEFSDIEEFPDIEVVDFPFPLHVSRLRSTTPGEAPSLTDLGGRSRPVRLAVPLEQVTLPSDTIPVLTEPQTTVREELALDAIVKYIQKHHVDYVLIRATDEYDKLFLARTVAEYCPHARILIEGSSRLLIHPDFAPYLRGTLVACTYPLFMSNQEWSYPQNASHNGGRARRLTAFSEGHVVSYYNAVALSVFRIQNVVGGNSTANSVGVAHSPQLLDYSAPFRSRQTTASDGVTPPVWICVVGNGVLIPLSWREVTQADRQQNGTVPFPEVHRPPSSSDESHEHEEAVPLHFSSSIVILLTALVIWTGCISVAQSVFWRRPDGMQPVTVEFSWSLKELFGVRLESSQWRTQSRYLLLLNLVTWAMVTGCAALLWIPALVRWHAEGGGPVPPMTLLAALAGSIVGSQMLMLTGPPDPAGFEPPFSRSLTRSAWCFGGICLFGLSLVILVGDFNHNRDMLLLTLLVSSGSWLLTVIALQCRTRYRNWPRWLSDWLGTNHPLPHVSRVWFCSIGLVACLSQWMILPGIRFAWMYFFEDIPDSYPLGEAMLLFERSMDWSSGASLLTPYVLLWGAATVWLISRLQRVALIGRARIDAPWPCPGGMSEKALARCLKGMDETHGLIESIVTRPCSTLRSTFSALFPFVFVCFGMWSVWLIANWSRPALDGKLSVVTLVFLLILVAVWILWLWESAFLLVKLRKLLREVAWTPLLAAASRLPDRVRKHLGRFLSPPPTSRRRSHLRVRVHYLKELAHTFPHSLSSTAPWKDFDADSLRQAEVSLADEIGKRDKMLPEADLEAAAALTCRQMNDAGKELFRRLVDEWEDSGTGDIYPRRSQSSEQRRSQTQRDVWIELAEEAVVLQFVSYTQYYLRHLRYMVFGGMLFSVFLSLALLSYPLHPGPLLLSMTNFMLLVTAGLGMGAVLVFDRQDLLRNLIGEDAPELQQRLQTGTSLLGYGLPVVLMLLRQFSPDSLGWMLSAFDPLLTSGG